MNHTYPRIGLTLIGLLGVHCGGEESPDMMMMPTPTEVIDVTENITTDTTWTPATYRLSGDFVVEATLTIAPCAIVQPDARIFVRNGGAIVARGTAECPVRFTSSRSTPAPGDWRYIDIDGSADNGNVFEHAILEYGGEDGDTGLLSFEAGVALRDAVFRGTPDNAVRDAGGRLMAAVDVSFTDIGGYPLSLRMDNVAAVGAITVTDAQRPAIEVQPGDALNQDATWEALSVPYQIRGDFRIEAVLTVLEGTTLLITAGDRGFVRDGGELRTMGTAAAPVVIRSSNDTPGPGDWRQIDFERSAGGGTVLNETIIRHGGADGVGAITTDIGIELNQVRFEDNAMCDVALQRGAMLTGTSASDPMICM